MHVTLRGKVSIDDLLTAAERLEYVAEDRYGRSGLVMFEPSEYGISLSFLEGDRRDQVLAVLTDLAVFLTVQASDDDGRPVWIQAADRSVIVR